MPRLSSISPKYRLHRASGQAVVTQDGRDYYLGRYNSRSSRRQYERLVGEWLAGGRQLAIEPVGVTIVEVLAAYLKFAKGYYLGRYGKPSDTIYVLKSVMRLMRRYYGDTQALAFGPLALKALRERMIDLGWSRTYINDQTSHIKRMFRWAASEELVPASVWHALQTVTGLRKGRSAARETAPVKPVNDAVVERTLPHLPQVVADMVRFQRLTGCRPDEVCSIRLADVDTSGDMWLYTPTHHKTEHHGRHRVIAIGPRAQEVLRRYCAHTCCERLMRTAIRLQTANENADATCTSKE